MMANFWPRLFGAAPGISCASVRKLRDEHRQRRTCSATITDDGCDFATSTSGVSATTVSVSDKLRDAQLEVDGQVGADRQHDLALRSANPESSTAIAYGAGCSATAR